MSRHPPDELKRILQAQVRTSRQIKVLGKNLLDLTQLVHSNIGRDKQNSPVDSNISSFLVSDIATAPTITSETGIHHSQGLTALLVEGNYHAEWSMLSQNLFHLGVMQASVAGDPSIAAATGSSSLERFDMVFMPFELDMNSARQIQQMIQKVNYLAVFVAVTDGPGGEEPLRMDWDQWFQEVISARATIDEVSLLVNRHFQPLDPILM